ncbi:MAG: hypothetical protein KDN22_15105 [Verrucomicrobiae bacterium]|nr:hypothetical protein [Verrucomicrobiae bacterium]
MKKLKRLVLLATIMAGFSLSAVTQAQEPDLLFDLIGGDLTDPEDDGDPESDVGYNAIFSSSEEPSFGGGEAAFNVFDNELGGGNSKWCCGDQATFPTDPIWVQASFDLPINLTGFTIASANDTEGRDPVIWEIQGSNGGEFVTIFRQEDDFPVWDSRDQVASYEVGDDFEAPAAYTTFRFYCEATGLTDGARFQLAEIELFGNPADLETARFLRLKVNSVESVVLTLIDGDQTTVDADSLQLKIDDATVPATVTKDGDITSVTYAPATPWEEGSEHTYSLTALDSTGGDIGSSGTFLTATPIMPLDGIPGPEGTASGWGFRQIWDAGTVSGLARALEVAADPDGIGAIFSDTVVPLFNFAETVSSPDGGGIFLDDAPLPAEAEGLTPDGFVLVGHINVEHAGGDLTIGVHTDDGFGMQLIGGEFSEVYGVGALDTNFPQFVTFANDTGDSNTRAVARDLPAGLYTLEVITWENGGGAVFEFYAASGDFAEDADADEWFLIGDPDGPLQPRASVDTDGDGMSDQYELANGLDINVDDAAGDLDEDSLSNKAEFDKGMKANNVDSDGDGLRDNFETDTGTYVNATNTGTDPIRSDSDHDGLKDIVETNTKVFVSDTDRGTDPFNSDTDGDGFSDGLEVKEGSDPLNKLSLPGVPTLGTELLGMDLTDPEDDGDPDLNDGYNAVFDSSEEADFGTGEAAFNVFDNVLGGGDNKWCCGDLGDPQFPEEPIWITATFEDPIVLTHFTISSANDTPGRDPLIWEIQGSNDQENFTTIYRQEDTETVWGADRNLVAEFRAGNNYDLPAAYTTIRFICFETGLTTGARFQLAELEYFGTAGSVGPFAISDVKRISRDGQEILQITFPSTANGTYAVETGTDLDKDWQEVTDGYESQGESTIFELPLEDPVPEELYIRVREE